MNLRAACTLVTAFLLTACSHQRAEVIPPKPPEPIRLLSVQPFEGSGGLDVTRDITQALKAAGWTIATKNQKADASLIGVVNEYRPNQKVMVFLGETNTLTGNKTVAISNPVVSMNGSQVLPQGPSGSVTNPHMVTERAVVGVTMRLLAMPKGNAVWGDSFTYESLDLTSARQIVTTLLARSLNRAAPHLKH